MARIVELIFRANNTSAIRALREIGTASQRTATESERAFQRSQRAIRAFGDVAERSGRLMTGIGLGMGYVGYKSVRASTDFQTAMTRIQTQARVGAREVNTLSREVLALGGSGTQMYKPTELANALYHIASVATGDAIPGLKGTAAYMNTLKIATKGAAIGGSNLEDTTTALVGVMAALHAPAKDAAAVMGMINTTVGIGNMRMQDLVTAMGSGIIPAFRDYGYTAKDALSAIALFSDQGTKASSSSRQLATALHYLTGPTKKAQEALAYLHIPAQKFVQDAAGPGGLIRALTDISKGMQGQPQWVKNIILGDIFPAGRGRVLLQALNSLQALQGKMNVYGSNAAAVKQLNDAYDATSKTLNFKAHAALAQINTDMINFGNTLIPIVAKWLPRLVSVFTSVFGWLSKLPRGVKSFLVDLTGFMLIGGPLLIFVGRIAKAVAALRDLRKALYATRDAEIAANEVPPGSSGGLGALLRAFGVVAAGGYIYKKFAHQLSHGASDRPLRQVPLSHQLPGGSANPLQRSITGHSPTGPIGGLLRLFGASPPNILGIPYHKGGVVRRYATGGFVGPDDQPALLQTGEGVLNRMAMGRLGVGGLNALNAGGGLGMAIQASPVYLVLDGRTIARSVINYTLRSAARGPSSLVGGSLVTGVSTARAIQ